MKVLNFVRPENGLTEDPLYYLHFDEYEDICGDFYLFMADFTTEIQDEKYNDKKKIAITFEEPNFCVGDSPHAVIHEYADKIYTLCPFISEVDPKRELIFFPFHQKYIPRQDLEKTIDIVYFGSIPQSFPFTHYINDILPKFNYRFGQYSRGNMRRCTYQQKLEAIASSKITLIHGLCNTASNAEARFRAFPNGDKIKAFNCIKSHSLTPQVKSRMFEAAFCKSLMLVQRDPFNVIEYWFEPNKDFIYFDNANELQALIKDITENFDKYLGMIDNANRKAMNNYTVNHFVNRYLKNV